MFKATRGKNRNLNMAYSNQVQRSINRGHPLPTYSRTEFKLWSLASEDYNEIYSNWIKAYCEYSLSPSVDRLDETRGYSFDNIQWVTTAQNLTNHTAKISTGEARPYNSKYIAQYSMVGVQLASFISCQEAARQTLGNFQNISNACNGRQVSSGGYKWAYISEEEYLRWVVKDLKSLYKANVPLHMLESKYKIPIHKIVEVLYGAVIKET